MSSSVALNHQREMYVRGRDVSHAYSLSPSYRPPEKANIFLASLSEEYHQTSIKTSSILQLRG
jgi:hypothetical protein